MGLDDDRFGCFAILIIHCLDQAGTGLSFIVEPVALPNLILDSNNVESCRRLIARGQGAKASLARFSGFTLSGAMELFLSAMEEKSSSNLLVEMEASAREGHPIFNPLLAEWHRRSKAHCAEDIHGTRSVEFFRIRDAASIQGTDFQLARERMSRSMGQAGFSKDFALALAKVFHEMADNVNQHSLSAACSDELTGLAGYYVADGYVAFCVADLGIGAWGSLGSSRSWGHLKSATEALKAIIVDHASRRDGQGEGDGFKQVLRALADRNAMLRLRSDDASVLLRPRDDQREAAFFSSPQLRGMQVSLACDLRNAPEERQIAFPD